MTAPQRTLSRLPHEAAAATAHTPAANANAAADAGLKLVIEALGRLRYGAIQLTVHDGRLVQVDVTERSRFAAS
jgi:hypothetical protein